MTRYLSVVDERYTRWDHSVTYRATVTTRRQAATKVDQMLVEVLTGTLVNTIAVTGRWIASELVAPRGRRSKRDVEIATWFDTYQLSDATPDLSGLPEGLTED